MPGSLYFIMIWLLILPCSGEGIKYLAFYSYWLSFCCWRSCFLYSWEFKVHSHIYHVGVVWGSSEESFHFVFFYEGFLTVLLEYDSSFARYALLFEYCEFLWYPLFNCCVWFCDLYGSSFHQLLELPGALALEVCEVHTLCRVVFRFHWLDWCRIVCESHGSSENVHESASYSVLVYQYVFAVDSFVYLELSDFFSCGIDSLLVVLDCLVEMQSFPESHDCRVSSEPCHVHDCVFDFALVCVVQE